MQHSRLPARLLAGFLSLTLLALPAGALTLEEARSLLEAHYIDPLPPAALEQTTVDGLISALGDPYTVYFTPEEYAAFLDSMQDTDLVGIGIVSVAAEEGLSVTQVFPDSPAHQGGVLPGDLILAVDGTPTAGLPAEDASALIRGEAGTTVTLTIRREAETLTLPLVRAHFYIPNASFTALSERVGLIACTSFGPETVRHFRDAVASPEGRDMELWTIDLRNNGGGLTQAAAQIAAIFAGPNDMGYLLDADGGLSVLRELGGPLTEAPVITLTNGDTASSSEILASCIRDLDLGLVVGERTFGKGVAQSLLDREFFPTLFPDGDALKVTSSRYYSPNGSTPDTIGIIPHLLVPEDLAPQVAELLSAPAPGKSNYYLFRLDFMGSWYIDKRKAADPAYRDAMEALLSAIPSTAKVWVGVGGVYNDWKPTSPAVIAQNMLLDYHDRGFTDVDSSPFASRIDLLGTYRIVSGVGDGTFNPKGTLTRSQLCALLAQALGCRLPTGESAFTDVSMSAWYGPAVNALADMGLVSGVGNGRFAPDAPVTHEQFFAIMGRLGRKLDLNLLFSSMDRIPEDLNVVGLFPYAPWAREDVWLLSLSQQRENGEIVNLLWNDPGKIAPQAPTTREEAAGLLCNLLVYTGALPI